MTRKLTYFRWWPIDHQRHNIQEHWWPTECPPGTKRVEIQHVQLLCFDRNSFFSLCSHHTENKVSLWITETCLHVTCVVVIYFDQTWNGQHILAELPQIKFYEYLGSESLTLPSRYRDGHNDTIVILLKCFANAPKNSSAFIVELMTILHTALTSILYTQMYIILKMFHLD
jgi:hypothetical protein